MTITSLPSQRSFAQVQRFCQQHSKAAAATAATVVGAPLTLLFRQSIASALYSPLKYFQNSLSHRYIKLGGVDVNKGALMFGGFVVLIAFEVAFLLYSSKK